MRIPLDYYRILGLPIQATDEQLSQAHGDRTLQLPRREFSGLAIESRKQLIDEAYGVLSDPEQRRDYDARFLASTYVVGTAAVGTAPAPAAGGGTPESAPGETGETSTAIASESAEPLAEVNTAVGEAALRSLASDTVTDAYTPTIEIEDAQLVGSLLILLELGEYELAIRLGRPYISSGSNSLENGKFGDPKVVLSDVVLVLSLSCLELGREQWQQRHYESAAESLETGRELLLREGSFPSIRNEIQTDLYKLRPYRVLELVSLPLNRNRERRQGIQVLKSMLQDRGGIDGTEDDLSGLSIDDFLRFVQQLRGYLTTSEQQELFEVEARRPSAVGVYLTVYAAMARGFAHHQPAFIRRAKKLLKRLGSRQDVHLEQAVCSLLLGQTEEASRALELSQEYQPLAFIRENSKGSPDLLPGLCLYAERWLRQEVFPHFRDLSQHQTSLKDYFANNQVQAYLESMPIEPDSTEPWVAMPSTVQPHGVPHEVNKNGHRSPPKQGSSVPAATANHSGGRPASPFQPPRPIIPQAPMPASMPERASTEVVAWDTPQPIAPPVNPAEQIPPAKLDDRSQSAGSPPTLSTAERISQLSPAGRLQAVPGASRGDAPRAGAEAGKPARSRRQDEDTGGLREQPDPPELKRPSPRSPKRPTPSSPRSQQAGSLNWVNLALVALVVIFAMGTLGFVSMRVLGWIGGLFGGPRIKGTPLQISLAQPPVDIPSVEEIAAQSPGVNDIAQSTLQKWFDAKAVAMGQTHQIDRLEAALTGGQLTSWRQRAEDALGNNWHWEYEHSFDIQSVSPDDPNTNRLTVQVEVREKATFYEQGKLNPASSYDEVLQMRYELILDAGEWRIQSAEKLN